MVRLEDLNKGAIVTGIAANAPITVVDVKWHGSDVIEVFYKDASGRTGHELVYRDQEDSLEVEADGARWSFKGDGALFRLAMEALRIRLSHLFDPLLAVHTSKVLPLPHQITAVYEEMLRRQPLRFLLADDPGAGKTIMTGLLLKELIARGDVSRCMIVSPGSLVNQWQEELREKFHLEFKVLTSDQLDTAASGNWFQENHLVICRLDKLSRSEDVQQKLKACDWDLVVVDEAHKMSASFYGSEIKRSKRYELGQVLSGITRNFLLLTATPHNGKDGDFQLFLQLIDPDRFELHAGGNVPKIDPSDIMRRMIKEKLLKFNGERLFPQRKAYTVTYDLSPLEEELYNQVTDYVSDQFNLADKLDGNRSRNTVGFALTSLQRRLASSPEAILHSLIRRRDRLKKKIDETEAARNSLFNVPTPRFDEFELDDMDPEEAYDELSAEEQEEAQDLVIDEASAARTVQELQREVALLDGLVVLAQRVHKSGTDAKWRALSETLQDKRAMFNKDGSRKKLVIFTEHRDTLNYLTRKIKDAIGRPEAVVTIDGTVRREDRARIQEQFKNDKDVLILIATDAAGEGINLQCAHLMINYDLPWNPNRLEQRFGRIHRIGQEEVCHLWNLIADKTREGAVYSRLLLKIEEECAALNDQVFNVLGEVVYNGEPLYKLLTRAIREGNDEVKKREYMTQVDEALDKDKLRELIDSQALVDDAMDFSAVQGIRAEMERANAARLQPHFIESFFIRAFEHLGGTIRQREPRRFEVLHVPSIVRKRIKEATYGASDPGKYARVTFERDLVSLSGKQVAEFICPGHPLLDTVIAIITDQYGDLLQQGAVLVDPSNASTEPRVLVALEHEITDGRVDKNGQRRVASKRFQFVEISQSGEVTGAGPAPYLDYRPMYDEEEGQVSQFIRHEWLSTDFEAIATSHAATALVPSHYSDINQRRERIVTRTMAAVNERLTSEINYWDQKVVELQDKEEAGKKPKLNSDRARTRRDDLRHRKEKRLHELEQEKKLSRGVPIVAGGALIIPACLLVSGSQVRPPQQASDTQGIERLAVDAVLAYEQSLGFRPVDVGKYKRGYDVESVREDGSLRFIEVKGRVAGADTVTVTKNEILTALNQPEDYILAIVEIEDGVAGKPIYILNPFSREPDFGVTAVTYKVAELKRKVDVLSG